MSEASRYEYEGDELRAMDGAVHYHAHVLRCLAPATVGRVLELGAGLGAITRQLVSGGATRVVAVEPDTGQAAALTARMKATQASRVAPVHVEACYLEQLPAGHQAFDSAIAVNVLEHIADDRAWLRLVAERVRPRGYLGLWVPALPANYGSLDSVFGHVQRYTRTRLTTAVRDAGWEPVARGWRNLPNIPSWWWMGKVAKATTLSAEAVNWYDRWVARWWLPLERHLPLPVGNNCWIVARRPTG